LVRQTEYVKYLGQRHDTQLSCDFIDDHFSATRIERRQKTFACWCVVHLFGAAGYANQRFDFVIVRSEFLVSEGPILAPAVLHALRLEVKRAKTITAPTPKVRAAAHGAQARPREC